MNRTVNSGSRLLFTAKTRSVIDGLIRPTRLATGLIMLTYVLLHLINHALGVFSLATMEAAQPYLVGPFRWPGVGETLGLAALTHLLLAMWALYNRRHLRMEWWEATQMILGLCIPPLLFSHLVSTRVAYELFGVDLGYSYVVWHLTSASWKTVVQILLLIIAWTHACFGIHYWLRFRGFYPKIAPYLLIFASLLPVLALLGFLHAAQEVARLDATPKWHRAFVANAELPMSEGVARLYAWRFWLFVSAGVLLVGTYSARGFRHLAERRRGIVEVRYGDGRSVAAPPGLTLLEVSRLANIPHASICGGRGRCSTCRVRVGRGLHLLAPPNDQERRILARISAASNVRLACQTRLTSDLEVVPLFPVHAHQPKWSSASEREAAREVEIVVMFADLRGFTQLVEERLPYDTVYILNRYFARMGEAIQDTNGYLDKFLGDGVMALFGLDGTPAEGAQDALRAAKAMQAALAELNQELSHDLSEPLRLGIGIHAGPAIVGRLGWGTASSLTAIGDMVNTASRLEALTKRYECEVIASTEVGRLAGIDLDRFAIERTSIRGRIAEIDVIVIADAQRIPDTLSSGRHLT